MTLTFGLHTPRDLLEKLKRDAALLAEEVTSDRFFNFVVTGYSIIDWIKNGDSVPATVKTAVAEMYREPWIRICGDIAIASKHFNLTRRVPVTSIVEPVEYGFGHRFGEAFGAAGHGMRIELNDGTSFSHVTFVTNVVEAWETFFRSHGL
jgi:hypothetical protein